MTHLSRQAGSPISQWVTFTLDGETYGIDVMQVQEVLRMTEIAPVPGAPYFVMGIVNLRGNVVTVIDARKRFGLSPREPDDATRIVIVEASKLVIGMLVDSVAEVVDIPESQIENSPGVGAAEHSAYIRGVFSREEGLLILVDLDQLLAEQSPDGAGSLF